MKNMDNNVRDGDEDVRGYSYLRIKYRSGSLEDNLISYLKKQRVSSLKELTLESLKIFWLPYLLSFLGRSKKEVQKEVDVSYQKFMNHFELMCIQLDCKKSLPSIQPIASQKTSSFIEDEDDGEDDDEDIFRNATVVDFE